MSSRSALPRRAAVAVCLAIGATLLPGAGPALAAPAAVQTVSVCTEAALRTAIDEVPDGGTVAITCEDPIVVSPEGGSTIVVEKTITISGTGHRVIIDGAWRTALFVVQAGPAVESPEDLPTLTLRDLVLTRGWSQDAGNLGGGAVWSLANLVTERVAFVDNRAFNRGGAILAEGAGRLTVRDSTFTGNRVTCPVDGSGGGAIAVRQRQQTTISGSTFTGNIARGLASGGAVLAYLSRLGAGFPVDPPPAPLPADAFSAPLVITDSTFTDNEVILEGAGPLDVGRMYGGGAVASLDHPLTVSGTRFEDNVVTTPAIGYGGALLAAAARNTATVLTDVAVVGNGFPDRVAGRPTNGIGGGIALHGTPATLRDVAVEGNRAFVGGGLSTRGGPVEVVDSAVERNVAGAVVPGTLVYGGGLSTHGPLLLTRSAVRANSGGSCYVVWGGGGPPTGEVITDGGGNDVDDPGTCFRPVAPAAPPPATGALSTPAASAVPGTPVSVSGGGFAPGARLTLVGYLLGAPAPAPPAAGARTAAARTAATQAAQAAPVDLGAGQADDSGAFSANPVLPGRGVWQVVALGTAPDGTTAALSVVLAAAAPGSGVAPVVTASPVPVTAAAGTPVTLTAAGAGLPAPTVQWQLSTDGGAAWTDVPGATTGTLSTTAGVGTTLYRAVFTNSSGRATSASAAVPGTTGTTGVPVADPGGETPPGATAPAGPQSAVAGPAGAPAGEQQDAAGAGLARTGVELIPLAGAALAVLAFGGFLLLAARRRSAR